MEMEAFTLKRKYLESRRSYKEIKRELRDQRDKTRTIINICGDKLLEKENDVLQIRKVYDQELAKIACDLLYLRSNMLKEQKILQSTINSQHQQLQLQQIELEKMNKINKKLLHSGKPTSRPSVTTILTSDIDIHNTSSEDSGSPKSSFNKSSSFDNSSSPDLKNITMTKSPQAPALPPRRHLPHDGKPPIPSRAGVNRKLHIKKDEDFNGFTGDEGFCSSHEDQQSNRSHVIISSGRQHCTKMKIPNTDLKFRSKLRSISDLGALEEHQVTSNNQENLSPVTTVTYVDYF